MISREWLEVIIALAFAAIGAIIISLLLDKPWFRPWHIIIGAVVAVLVAAILGIAAWLVRGK